jgi:hypothetical protein
MKTSRPYFDTSTPLFRVALSLAAAWVLGFSAYGAFTGGFNRIVSAHFNSKFDAQCSLEGY